MARVSVPASPRHERTSPTGTRAPLEKSRHSALRRVRPHLHRNVFLATSGRNALGPCSEERGLVESGQSLNCHRERSRRISLSALRVERLSESLTNLQRPNHGREKTRPRDPSLRQPPFRMTELLNRNVEAREHRLPTCDWSLHLAFDCGPSATPQLRPLRSG